MAPTSYDVHSAAPGQAAVDVDGDEVVITTDQVQVIEGTRTGWAVATSGGFAVALDVTIDRHVRLEGLARDLVRSFNDLRRRLDLPLDRRILVAAVGVPGSACASTPTTSCVLRWRPTGRPSRTTCWPSSSR